jgi:hypothetical protein
MKTVALVLVLAMTCLAGAKDDKEQAPSREIFAKAVKLLKFGQTIEYYEPAKGDAVAALGLLGDEQAVPILVEHLANEKDAELRFRIIKALGWINSRKAVPALEKALKDDDLHVRNGAALALKGITGKEHQAEKRPKDDVPGPDELTKEITRLRGGDRPGSGKPIVEVGKTYHFSFGKELIGELAGKVLEAPVDNWVKIQTRKDDKTVTNLVNLATVLVITLEPDAK